ncbi:fluoride efflux transporter FluC [Streptomyces avicenniae]|uniref:fluoride efflux transporter FluC n=1 Tax=Streptomyces avicenniae TaxID=500153 RepID=UPI0006998050|nr:CrcB family protein [Streptomyces avicenniae]
MNWLLVIAGALAGAPLRYLTDRAVQARLGTLFPWGTFLVNALACAALGFLGAAAFPANVEHLLGPGLCATYSTYSTFSWETLRLAEAGAPLRATANALASPAVGLATAFLGAALADTLGL